MPATPGTPPKAKTRGTMKVFPSGKHDWFALLLFPFKAYLVTFYPFYRIFRQFCPQPFLGTSGDGTLNTLLGIAVNCGIPLLNGGLIQLAFGGWHRARTTLAFVPISVLILILLV